MTDLTTKQREDAAARALTQTRERNELDAKGHRLCQQDAQKQSDLLSRAAHAAADPGDRDALRDLANDATNRADQHQARAEAHETRAAEQAQNEDRELHCHVLNLKAAATYAELTGNDKAARSATDAADALQPQMEQDDEDADRAAEEYDHENALAC